MRIGTLLAGYLRISMYILLLRTSRIQDASRRKSAESRPQGSLSFHVIPGVMDIWIMDWAPVPVSNSEGEIVLVKAIYNPTYISGKFAHYATADNQAGYDLSSVLNLKTVDFPLVWDIGNFTHNGKWNGDRYKSDYRG